MVRIQDALFRLFLALVPLLGAPAGRLTAALVHLRRPRFLVRGFIDSYFVRRLGVDLDEAEKPAAAYPTILDFFTRRLKKGARPVDRAPGALVSPADGVLASFGRIDGGTVLQVKGMPYRVSELLEGSADAWEGGTWLTIYLSPKDYHRVHHPAEARLVGMRPIPGRLYPVNDRTVSRVPRVFSRNRRTIFEYRRGRTPITLVMVTAFNVGRITPLFGAASFPGLGLPVKRGGELAAFELGSTVVLLLPKGAVRFSSLKAGLPLRMGRRLGVFTGK
ncbi:MAG: phosphatidylserine decarboxylase [Spirochaetes bacterium]|nr:phosphatidylserine decarboxylase [Spirochaetota bacterium]